VPGQIVALSGGGCQDGLGFLPGSACPHFLDEPTRRPAYQQVIADGFWGGVAIDGGAGVHFRGQERGEVVSERPGAQAVRIFAATAR
jgi:hypothetical protein